jgi:hypothetical protein
VIARLDYSFDELAIKRKIVALIYYCTGPGNQTGKLDFVLEPEGR